MTPELTKRLLSNFFEAVRNTFGGDASEPDGPDDLDSSAPGVYLGAFGKHPGWDDHVDDMGLETPLLLWAKRLLYTDGIAGNIDKGEWDRLPPADRLEQLAWDIHYKQAAKVLNTTALEPPVKDKKPAANTAAALSAKSALRGPTPARARPDAGFSSGADDRPARLREDER